MKPPRKSCAVLLLVVASHALAVWGYSLSATLAMYDGVVSVCRPFASKEVEEARSEFLRKLSPEERARVGAARTTDEYKEVLEVARKDATKQVLASKGKEHEACLQLLHQ